MGYFMPRPFPYPGPDVNESRANLIIGLSATLLILASSAVTFRFFVRWLRRLSWQADDSLIILSLVFVILQCIGNIVSTSFGNGTHAITRAADVVNSLLADYLLTIVYIVAIFFLKMTYLELYRRVLPSHNSWFNRSLYFMTVAVALWSLSAIVVTVFSCWPISDFWHRFDLSAHGLCADLLAMQLSFSIIHSAMDIVLLILPLTMLHTLHTSRRSNFELGSMFFLGVCTCAASIFRVNAVYVAYPSLNTEQDPTYDGISLLLTSALEPTLGIICACLPIIYPFLTSHCSLSRLNSPPASPSAKAPLLPITSTESNYAIKSTTSQLHPPQKPSTKKPFTKKPATREFYHSPSPMPLISLTRKPSNHPLNQNPSPKGTKALKEPEPAHFHVHTQALTLSQPCSTFRTRDLFRPFIREQGRPSGLTNEICRGSTAPVGSVVGVDDEGGEIRGGIVVKRSLEWRESMGEGLVEVNHSEARTRRGLWEDVALAR